MVSKRKECATGTLRERRKRSGNHVPPDRIPHDSDGSPKDTDRSGSQNIAVTTSAGLRTREEDPETDGNTISKVFKTKQ